MIRAAWKPRWATFVWPVGEGAAPLERRTDTRYTALPAAHGRRPTSSIVAYHDEEWGVPEWDDRALFEKLILDGFQAGLSWITILA